MSLTKTTDFLSDAQKHQKEEEFKKKRYAMSYSSEKVLAEDPQRFYREKILGIRPKVIKKSFDEGHLMHTLILEPHKFKKEYAISKGSSPLSDNVKAIIHDLFDFREKNSDPDQDELSVDLAEWKPILLNLLKAHNLYQRMGDDKKLERVINKETEEYWNMLLENRDKIMVSQEQYDTIKKKVDNFFKNGKTITDKMGLTEGLNSEQVFVLNEHMAYLDRPELPFDEKGILDNLCVHFDHEKIYVNDVKSTGSSLDDFEYDIRKFKYHKQAAKYHNLAEELKRELVKREPLVTNYPIEFRFVVIDKNGYFGSIKVSDETLTMWKEWHQQDLQKLRYHFDNWDFNTLAKYSKNHEITL